MRSSLMLAVVCSCAVLCRTASPQTSGAEHLTRDKLLGAWRLVGIEYSGPKGSLVDPFYQAGSTGIIIYEPSGWMSVHIVAPNRQAWEVPASRVSAAAAARDVPLKVAAFDSYYAYYGTWDFNESTSVVTHHVRSSLVPAESGIDYAQTVALDGGRLVFTTHGKDDGQETTRRKVWERIASTDTHPRP